MYSGTPLAESTARASMKCHASRESGPSGAKGDEVKSEPIFACGRDRRGRKTLVVRPRFHQAGTQEESLHAVKGCMDIVRTTLVWGTVCVTRQRLEACHIGFETCFKDLGMLSMCEYHSVLWPCISLLRT
jgi:hypothetical protein